MPVRTLKNRLLGEPGSVRHTIVAADPIETPILAQFGIPFDTIIARGPDGYDTANFMPDHDRHRLLSNGVNEVWFRGYVLAVEQVTESPHLSQHWALRLISGRSRRCV